MRWRWRQRGGAVAKEGTGGESISQKARWGESPGCLVGFFSVFFLAGLGFLIPIFVLPTMKVVAARSWTPTDCEILSSYVATHAGEDGSTYSVEVTYRYQVDGATYTSDRYEFMGGSSSGQASKQKVVEDLPEGSTTTCWVDPDEPTEAVLYRGFTWVYLFALLPLTFVAVGGGGMAYALSRWRAESRPKATRPGLTLHDPPAGTFREIDEWGTPVAATGPVVLEEKLGPLGKLLALIGVGAFWNGIVSVFVWHVWDGWRAGHGIDGCAVVFLIPFVLVGLLFLVGVPYQLLALANPRPRLTLSRAAVPLGGAASLEWRFSGAARRLRDLRIWLEGTESATYQRGTSTYTDTETFASIEVVKRQEGMPVATGIATVEIPADTMHSFEANHNKILWTLKLTASIARWPDVVTEFPFVVQPGEGPDR